MSYLVRIHHRWTDSRDRGFLSMVDYNPAAHLLDMGCGDGEFTMTVARKIGTTEVYGADVWEDGLKSAASKGVKTIKTDLNCATSIPSDSFDVVISNQVIEHLYDPEKYLREIRRIMKPGGYGIISTENLASWDNILSLLMGYTPFSMCFGKYKIGNPLSPHNYLEDDTYPSHVRIFTYTGLLQFLPIMGFHIEKVDAAGHILSEWCARRDKRHSRFLTVRVSKTTDGSDRHH